VHRVRLQTTRPRPTLLFVEQKRIATQRPRPNWPRLPELLLLLLQSTSWSLVGRSTTGIDKATANTRALINHTYVLPYGFAFNLSLTTEMSLCGTGELTTRLKNFESCVYTRLITPSRSRMTLIRAFALPVIDMASCSVITSFAPLHQSHYRYPNITTDRLSLTHFEDGR
jgi:hypothetical protein